MGYGVIETLISVFSSSIDILSNILNLISNSYYKELKLLEKNVYSLTKKQKNYLSNIKALNKDVTKVCKYLKWIGYALLFVSMATILGTAYTNGRSIDRAILDCAIEALINLVVQGAGDLFNKVAKYIPYIGFLISVIGGWLLSYALQKLFNSKKIVRVKNKFSTSTKNLRINFWNWLKAGLNSLTA